MTVLNLTFLITLSILLHVVSDFSFHTLTILGAKVSTILLEYYVE